MTLLGTIGAFVGNLIKPRMKTGIDVSHWNGIIDWHQVATKNNPAIEYAFIKASTGVGGSDPKFRFNSTEAKKAGLKIGYYHFASLNTKNITEDAQAEANFFLSVVKTGPVPDLPLILDIEIDDPKVQLDEKQVLTWIKAFFSILSANGYRYALYSFTPFLNSHLPTNHGLGHINLWLAQYNNKPQPKLPLGWSDYWIWQYSDAGSVVGIKGKVDLNRTIKL